MGSAVPKESAVSEPSFTLGLEEEYLLVDRGTLSKMWVLRRILNPMGTADAVEFILDKLKHTKNNADFFQSMNQ